jgi:hypothetical protein
MPDRHVVPVTPQGASIGRSHSPVLDLSNRPGKKIKPVFVPVTGKEFFFKHNYDPPPPRAITNKLLKLIEEDGLYGSPNEIKKVWETEQVTHRGYPSGRRKTCAHQNDIVWTLFDPASTTFIHF